MSGTLYVVATPIGNLEDITLRALRVLREVTVIAAEDTRRTAKLLAHHSIRTGAVSFQQHNTRTRLPGLLRRLGNGESVALVTDAGTPGVSDPGLELEQQCIENQIPVEPVPGVSAPLAALVGSGFPLIPFTIFGFVPNRSNARSKWLAAVAETSHTFSFFEAPHRIKATMEDAAKYFGDRPICLARELTKLHQEFLRGTAADLASRLAEPKGEFTVVVSPNNAAAKALAGPTDDCGLSEMFWRIANSAGTSRREAVRQVAKEKGISVRDVYAAVERVKNSGI